MYLCKSIKYDHTMLVKEDFEHIGFVGRSHGVQGEVACKLNVDLSVALEEDADNFFLMLEEQGLLIPYRVVSHRTKAGDIDLIRFDGITNKDDAENLTNRPVWLSREYLGEAELSDDPYEYSRYVGFSVYNDADKTLVGTVTEVDDSTLNTLLYIDRPSGDELILPIADDLFVGYNDEERLLMLRIPEGLLDDSGEVVD